MASSNENPFAALLAESGQVTVGINKKLVEEILLFTLRNSTSTPVALINLSSIICADNDTSESMNEEVLRHAIFERLLLKDPKQYLLENGNTKYIDMAVEDKAIIYLHHAYVVCESLRKNPHNRDDCEKIRKLIILNASTCIRQPEIFDQKSIPMQWLKLMEQNVGNSDSAFNAFLMATVDMVFAEENEIEALGALKSIFYPVLQNIHKRVMEVNLVSIDTNVFDLLSYFVCDKRLSKLGVVLIDYTTPNPNAQGLDYMDTIFGDLLAISILPKFSTMPPDFFSEPSHDANQTDANLWQLMAAHQKKVFDLMKKLLLLDAETKRKTLQWIAQCLHANKSRAQLWNNLHQGPDQVVTDNGSDAFMMGLLSVLLRLCEPLCEPTLKVLLVDPTYCSVSEEQRSSKEVSLVNVSEETCLLPADEHATRISADKYNFITEIFYMTHKAFELSYRSCTDKFSRMARELNNLQMTYQDIIRTDPNNDFAKNLMRMLQRNLQQYRCLRNCLIEPENDGLILKFFEASSIWLMEITLLPKDVFENQQNVKSYAPLKKRNNEIPPNLEFVPSYLNFIPEYILDNIVAYLNFGRQFPQGQLVEIYQSSHDAFFKMIVLFMGSSKLVKNPHLRAKLAEGLEFLLPKKIAGSMRSSFMTHVFDSHPERLKVVSSLLNVFVSIEMTGQSVQFEQKFNYRRPMYAIMEYLWEKEEQVQCFKDLAAEAEANMDAVEPPLFLRFINLLINDAIFLLDESLSNLQQIRQAQEAQDRGEWNSLSHTERQQQQSNLQSLGMMTRFDNILARDTVNMLQLLTTEIKSLFCHNSIVDRMAAMLNYFLLNLVGPDKEKFKVKDKKEYEFDPANIVLEISRIYVNLGGSDAFCLAVSQDGRSYTPELFAYTEKILIRIGGAQLIGDIADLAAKVNQIEIQYKKDQECIADAPDEFLDPIMSTIMMDPVILPSSKVTVDRKTIARHLLSDQTDPFNRSPLSMDKVKSNVELKAEIDKWIAEKRAGSTAQ